MRLWHRIQKGASEEKNSRVDILECTDDVISIKGPTVIWLSGGLTTDDPPLSKETLKGLTKKYFEQMFPYINLDDERIIADLTGKVSEYCAGNINMLDKILGFSYRQNVENNGRNKDAPNNDKVKIYCASYRSTEEVLSNQESCCRNPDHFFGAESMDMIRRLFLPVLSTDGAITYGGDKQNTYDMNNWKINGRRKSVDDIINTLNNVTFTGNSYGTTFLLQLENALQYTLNGLGYGSEDSRSIIESVYAVMISNISPYKAVNGSRFTSIAMEGINDRVAKICNPTFKTERGEHYYYPPVKTDKRENVAEKELPADTAQRYFSIEPCNQKNRLMVLSDINRRVSYWKERSGYFDYTWVDNDHTGHHVAHYMMRGEPYSVLPDLVERTVRNAVLRTKQPVHSMQDLFRPSQLWPRQDGAAFTPNQLKADLLTGMIRTEFDNKFNFGQEKKRLRQSPDHQHL